MQFFRIKNRRYVCSRLHHNLVPIRLTSHPVQYSASRIYRLYSYQLTYFYFLCCLFYDPVQGTSEQKKKGTAWKKIIVPTAAVLTAPLSSSPGWLVRHLYHHPVWSVWCYNHKGHQKGTGSSHRHHPRPTSVVILLFREV